jgi:serine/threonine protein kinase
MVEQFIGRTLAGKYRIEELWRSDVYSTTFHATQEAIDKPVTLKILNPDLAEFADIASSFQMEARVLSRIANPHILNVLDFGKDENGTTFLVLETAEGQTLRDFVQNEGGASLERANRIVRQLADALTIAHGNGVIHGNLSGEKITVSDRNGTEFVKILDFGVNSDANLDDEQTVVRPEMPLYKAPEQLSGGEVTEKTDIYALGVVLYQLLTGNTPFSGANSAELAQKHLREIPPSLIAARPDLPPVLEQVVQRALAKQPEQRFHSAKDFADALENAVKTSSYSENAAYAAAGFGGAPARPTPQTESQSAGNPYKTAFIVLAGIMVLSIVGIYATGGFRNTPTTQMNIDPNAQPVQPVNPTSSTGEDLTNLGVPNANSLNGNIDPSVIPPGGTVTGVPQGIPPGLYPPGTTGGQIVTIPGNSNSIFMGDLNANTGVPVNANTRPINANVRPANTNAAVNANVAATPRPTNTNTGNVNAAPKPTPSAAPASSPKPAPTKPAADKPKPNTDNDAVSPSN